MKLFVTEKEVRKYIKEIMENPPGLGWQMTGDLSTSPVSVSSVVDPSASLTDPGNPKFVPTNRVELQTALASIVNDVPDDEISGFYDTVKDTIEDINKDEDEMSKEDKKVEETIRASIRNMIKESKKAAMPYSTLKEFWDNKINEAKPITKFSSAAQKARAEVEVNKLPPAANPNKIVPTIVPPGVSGRAGASAKVPTKPSEAEVASLRDTLESMNFGANDEKIVDNLKSEKQNEAAIAEAVASVPAEDAIAFSEAFNAAKEALMEDAIEKGLSDEEIEILTRNSSITQTKTFEDLFDVNLEDYALNLGIKVRQILARAGQEDEKRGYLSKNTGSETLAGTAAALGPDPSLGKNWSVSQVNKKSQIALGKYILALKCIEARVPLNLGVEKETERAPAAVNSTKLEKNSDTKREIIAISKALKDNDPDEFDEALEGYILFAKASALFGVDDNSFLESNPYFKIREGFYETLVKRKVLSTEILENIIDEKIYSVLSKFS